MLEALLPWQEVMLVNLLKAHESRPMHAQLWVTPVAYGASRLAQRWLLARMCTAASALRPCGLCDDCRWVLAQTHPDVFWLAPLEAQGQIRIDAVRELRSFVDRTSARHGWRAVIVEQAHRLNEHAANALLKSLEEPGSQTLFVLLTDRLVDIMPTIRSRCGIWHLPAPDRVDALRWLRGRVDCSEQQLNQAMAYARSMPEQAELVLVKNWLPMFEGLWSGIRQLTQKRTHASIVVSGCKEIWQERLLTDALMQWVEDLIRTHSVLDSPEPESFLHHPELYRDYTELVVRQPRAVERIWEIWHRLVRVRDELDGNIQPALCYERILTDFTALF